MEPPHSGARSDRPRPLGGHESRGFAEPSYKLPRRKRLPQQPRRTLLRGSPLKLGVLSTQTPTGARLACAPLAAARVRGPKINGLRRNRRFCDATKTRAAKRVGQPPELRATSAGSTQAGLIPGGQSWAIIFCAMHPAPPMAPASSSPPMWRSYDGLL